MSAAGGVVRGQPVLIPYKWEAAAWAEIESRVVGMCAYEERGPGQGLGEEGGIYVVEWASALRRGGLATQMLREVRKGWARGKGRVELQVHVENKRAILTRLQSVSHVARKATRQVPPPLVGLVALFAF